MPPFKPIDYDPSEPEDEDEDILDTMGINQPGSDFAGGVDPETGEDIEGPPGYQEEPSSYQGPQPLPEVDLGYQTTGIGGSELGTQYARTLEGIDRRDPASLAGTTAQAATGPDAATATAGQATALEGQYFDPAQVDTNTGPYRSATAEAPELLQTIGQSVAGPGNIGSASVAPAAAPTAATVGTAKAGGPATVADIDLYGGADVSSAGGPTAADILVADEQGREAQLSGIDQLRFLAGGGDSAALRMQRERGLQDVMAMMASQRGVPTAAIMREGIRGQENVDRAIAEAAANQQMQAIQALGQQGGAMRQQDIGLASQQAQFEQQAGMAGAQMGQEAAMASAQFEQQAGLAGQGVSAQQAQANAQFQQQTGITQAQMDLERQNLQAQLTQQSNTLKAQMGQENAMANAQFEQQGYMTAADLESQARRQESAQMQQAALAEYQAAVDAAQATSGFQQQALMTQAQNKFDASMADAQFAQQSNLTQAELESTRRLEQAGLDTQAAIETARMETEVNSIAAQFQQQTNMADAQFEMERQQAELQANTQLEAQRDTMISSLLGMGLDFETARMQVDGNLSLERSKIQRDYFLGRMGARTELGRALIEGTSFFEGEMDQVNDNIGVLNQILAGGYTEAPTEEEELVTSSMETASEALEEVVTFPGIG